MSSSKICLYSYKYSGHCHRVWWLLNLLGLKYELKEINLRAKEQKSPEFLAINVFGQVPVLTDGELAISDSNAILIYLAKVYAPDVWLPTSAAQWAELQRWLSVAAGQVAYGPSAARRIKLFNTPEDLSGAQAKALALFSVMEQQLAQNNFLLGDQISLADIANYAYIARAHEGDIQINEFPNISAWLKRLEASKGFVAMPEFNSLP